MKILFATDGSDGARNAMELLTHFPFPGDRSAVVMTVLDSKQLAVDRHLALDEDQDRLLRETEQTLLEESGQLLATESARLTDAGWICSTELRRGGPAEEIIKAAEEFQPDVIVLGSHGHKGVKHFLLGSVSERVLRHAHCSVLIVKPSPGLSAPPDAAGPRAPWRILVAYDDSDPAKEAIGLCASLPLPDDTQISVVGIMPMIHMYRQDIRQHFNDIWRKQKHARTKTLEKAVDALQWSTPHVTAELLESTDVSREIVDIVKDRAMDLVVIGSKGRSTFKRFLLGSITSRVAGHAPCSVMVVRARASYD
jgi:nucleotide-binding universal stress UspA family protein